MNANKSIAPEKEIVAPESDSTRLETADKQPQGADMLTGSYGLAGVEWIFTEIKPGDGMNAPVVQARVQLVGVTHPDGRKIEVAPWRLSQEQGSCSEIDKPADEKVAALSYAQCWWAGGGNQFRAVRDGNMLRGDVRGVDEEEESPATFKQLVVIDLASIAK